ncbi:MAG: HD-GYP domain-containing protein [Planctomycetaceae bacterium]|nr:HD-GYP domain-containing protein [Planctomycetaceae bacterium]
MISLVKRNDQQGETLRIFRLDVSACQAWLNQAFQTKFLTWEWRESWKPLASETEVGRSEQEYLYYQHLERISPETGYHTITLENQDSLVILPIYGTPQRRILVGIVPWGSAEYLPDIIRLLIRQKHQARLLNEQHNLLEHYAKESTRNFLELGWFGKLIENAAFTENEGELTDAAHQALKNLQEFIQADSLAVVLCNPSASSDSEIIKRIINLGEIPMDEAGATRLLRMGGPNYFCESYLNNTIDTYPEYEESGIRSLMIAPALCNHRCFGWLIALKSDRRGVPARRMETPENGSHAMFSTRATILLEATASILATHMNNLRLLNEQQTLLIGTVRSLVNTLDAKDRYASGHSDRVAQIGKCIARELGLAEPDCQKIYLAGLLHDIGKIGVRDEVLVKPGKLTPEEYDEIKQHPTFGYEILKHLHQLQHVLPGVMHHHETWDGRGYPHQLKGEEIPMAARILAVSDAYDAMISDRPYRAGMPPQQAEAILVQGSGRQWDPNVVAAFFRVLPRIHQIISVKDKLSDLPVTHSEYAFEDDLVEVEDQMLSAILITTTQNDSSK